MLTRRTLLSLVAGGVAAPQFASGQPAPRKVALYANVGADLTNQNFVMVSPVSLMLTSQPQGSTLKLGCYGINGVTYQMQYSTNLVDWLPYGPPLIGSNCQMIVSAPIGAPPQQFFRFVTSY